jgi:hypothetical protein
VETVRPPAVWWALGALGSLTLWLVLAVALPWEVAAAAGLLTGALVTWGLVAAGVRVGVNDGEVVAGAAHVPLRHVGAVTPLDPEQTRRARGPEADANAFLVLRPWVATAVRVEITDPADPTPYWLVSTREPQRFAAAASTARGDAAR